MRTHLEKTVLPRCPRAGCGNSATEPGAIVCAVDFYALASSCRGKKWLGEPEAAMIEGRDRGVAYACVLCKGWHNGDAQDDPAAFRALLEAVVAALTADPRVGWRGILNLVDAWRVSDRSEWRLGLDQTAAYAYSVT
jgi:hypothetical protein